MIPQVMCFLLPGTHPSTIHSNCIFRVVEGEGVIVGGIVSLTALDSQVTVLSHSVMVKMGLSVK